MRSSILLLASAAATALAGPVQKRVLKTVIETDIVWVTVTEGETASIFFAGPHKHVPTTTSTTTTTTTSSTPPPPPPPPTTTSTPPPPPPPPTTTSTTSTPEPTTTVVAPAPEPTTSEEPAPTTKATVVIQQAQAVPAAKTSSSSKTSSSAAAAVDSTPSQPTDFASTVLYHHNIHRENNSAPAVSYGQTYAQYAEQVAQSCKFAHDLTPGGGGYGQNIASWGGTGASAATAQKVVAQAITNMWYNGEINQYPSSGYGQDNPDFTNFESWGHYSQVVWAGTQQVGCHATFCPAGTLFKGSDGWFSVCNYYPAGNMGGEYGANVLPPQGKSSVTA